MNKPKFLVMIAGLVVLLSAIGYYIFSHETAQSGLDQLREGMFGDEVEIILRGDWDAGEYEGRKIMRKKNPFNHCEIIILLDDDGKYSGEYLHKH